MIDFLKILFNLYLCDEANKLVKRGKRCPLLGGVEAHFTICYIFHIGCR